MRTLLVLLLAFGDAPRGELKLNGLFGDGMVLQRDVPCPVWGTADPGSEVAVSIAGQRKTVKAGPDGRWSLKLDPLPAGGPHELVAEGPSRVAVRDVVVGEVWIAAGGSKMEVPLKASPTGATLSDAGKFRLFRVPPRRFEKPQSDVTGTWKRDPQALADFSAIAALFGLQILEQIKVPVGLIQATDVDAPPQDWISMGALERSPAGRSVAFNNRRNRENFDSSHTLYYYAVLKAKERGRDPEAVPKPTALPPGPCMLHQGMIAPLIPYAIRGVVWYPSEAHVQEPGLLAAMIQGWREEWKQGDFPFAFVQLGGAGPRADEPEDSYRAEFRAIQDKVQALPNVGMAVSLDIGEPTEGRAKTLVDLARRLSTWAEDQVYGKGVVSSGPVFESMKSLGDKLQLKFKSAGSGLACPDAKISGFAVCDSLFQTFHWAEAKIEGNSVIVWSDKVQWPSEVRYAWGDHPKANLYNKEGFPAPPFKTDSFPRR
jgi:sialate O-acetylesterase